MTPALSVEGVGKAYKRYPNKWSRVREWLGRAPRHESVWVLRNVSFAVGQGEAVGIIGMNGAGKSTLLKIVTGTTHPTHGRVAVQGRVAALLELGMGFHPDFTGRQNVFMAGQILGLSNAQLQRLMPEIEAFAEIGEYIDRPVRTYSSGMQVRLAFSVATAVRPDVLIVDEALSVGDAYFQHKSFDRIRSFRDQGTSLLIVSHDRGAIQQLCSRAILLEGGTVAQDGKPEQVLDFYNARIAERGNATVQTRTLNDGRVQTVSGTGEARVEQIRLLDDTSRPIEVATVGQRVSLEAVIATHAPLSELVLGYMIKDRLGEPVYGTNTHHLRVPLGPLAPRQRITLRFDFDANLGVGSYSVATALHVADSHLAANYEWRDLALVFEVVNVAVPEFVGVNWLPPRTRVVNVSAVA